MKPGIYLFRFLIYSLIPTLLMGQDPEIMLQKFAQNNPQEKLSIHFDKNAYLAGETIWFKAYFYDGHFPVSQSYNLFIELISPDGKPVIKKRFPISGATAFGNVDLPDSLPSGNYIIAAFTPLLMNYGPESFYQKKINLYNLSEFKKPDSVELPEKLVIQFFPEGGNLVRGVPGIIAFKATNQWGIPVDVSGVVKLPDGSEVTSFSSYHDGMGKFLVRPSVGTKYIAYINWKNNVYTSSLPGPLPSGVTLKIEDEERGKAFTLSRSNKDEDKFDSLLLVAHINQQIVFKEPIYLKDNNSVKGHLNTESLSSGILHFTVFDIKGMPLAERLTFVDNDNFKTPGEIVVLHSNPGKRGSNAVEIRFPDSIQRSCSVSVTDIDNWLSFDGRNIYSDLFLSADLSGYIHQPSFYFNGRSDSISKALDLLMMTHGWRRFSWNEVFQQKAHSSFSYGEPSYLRLSGTVQDAGTKMPLTGGVLDLILRSPDSIPQVLSLNVNEQGSFSIDSLIYFDSTSVMVMYKNKKNKEQRVYIQFAIDTLAALTDTFSIHLREPSSNLSTPPFPLNTYMTAQGSNRDKKYKLLTEVMVKGRKGTATEQLEERYVKGQFATADRKTADLINRPSNNPTLSVADYVRNNFQPIIVVSRGGRKIFADPRKFSLGTGRYWEILVFMDNAPSSYEQLVSIPVKDVALIKLYNTGFYGGESGSPAGALVVFTKKTEDYRLESKATGVGQTIINGYSVAREFYQPDLSLPAAQGIIDNRTTLYWNPLVFTNEQSSVINFSFNGNDIGYHYKIIVQGFDIKGKLIYLEKIVGQ